MSMVKAVTFALFIVGVLTACSTASTPESYPLVPTDSAERVAAIAADPDLQAGQSIYDLRCAHCHGYSGEGQLSTTIDNTLSLGMLTVPPHDSSGHTWQHPDQLLRQVILQGIQNPLDQFPMPAFEGTLTEEEIDQTLDYIRLWWTDEQRTSQAELTQQRANLDRELNISTESEE